MGTLNAVKQDAFYDKRVQLETISPTGKKVSVTEWFVVELEQIEKK
ncbi:TPA: hypothetical protein ACGOWW_001785 [Streptococcus suis]|nr:hypothetical protein [Streptococcus suis]